MTAQTYRVNRPDVIDEQFDDEYVLVNLRLGKYYSLNRPAAGVWDLLNENLPRNKMLAQLEVKYAADSAQIAADLDHLLAEMVSEELIVPQPGAPAWSPAEPDPESAPAQRLEYIAPQIEKYTDMQALLLLDPIHQVDESGWPATKPDAH